MEDYTSKPSFNFYQSYKISLEFDGINLQNEYFLGDNFSKIIFLSALISKNEGIFLYKNIKLEIKGTFHNFTNINEIKCINKDDRINDKFLDLMHKALVNGFNVVEMFEKMRIYLSFYILKHNFGCTEIFKEEESVFGRNRNDVYRINEELECFENEIKK